MADGPRQKKEYLKPEVQSEYIYETMALSCAQCLNREPGTEFDFGEGNCNLGPSTY